MTRGGEILFRVLAVVAGVALGVGAMELGLRVAHYDTRSLDGIDPVHQAIFTGVEVNELGFRDGDLDLYVSNMFSSAGARVAYQRRFHPGSPGADRAQLQRHARGNTLFLNRGDGTFADASGASRTRDGHWAWGGLFTELDGDGWPDLFVPNGFLTQEGAGPDL